MILSSKVKSHDVPFNPTWDVIPLCRIFTCMSAPISLNDQISCLHITVLVSKSPSSYLAMAPEHKTSDAGSLNMPRRSCKVLPSSEKLSTA